MPPHETVRLKGTVADVFAHRFVLKTSNGNILADLTPPGAEKISLKQGDAISIEGEQKPSEVKISKVSRGGEQIEIGGPDPHGDRPTPDTAKATVAAAGYTTVGEPRPKPHHFEILGQKDGSYFELHVHTDGLRHEKPVLPSDPKWREEINGSGKDGAS